MDMNLDMNMKINMNINVQIQVHDGYITLLVYIRRLVKKTQTNLNCVKSHIRQVGRGIVLLVQDLRLHWFPQNISLKEIRNLP